MEKINIAELLKDCPKGMELDCTIYDNVKLIGVDEICITPFPIRVSRGDGYTMTLTKYGQYADADFAKCVIFPKGKTTWEGFVPPCRFKDGDICYIKTKSGFEYIIIFKSIENPDYMINRYVNLGDDGFLHTDNYGRVCPIENMEEFRLATEEEKQKLFDAIRDNGYKWNPEAKTLEKLSEPKFKVGDRIKSIISQLVYSIKEVRENAYLVKEKTGYFFIPFCLERKYELVPNKFDITTLKPFSKVLIRDLNSQIWTVDLFSFYDENLVYPFNCIGHCSVQCIPFKGNEHLLGTTNDCDEYYKNWG